MSIDFQAMWFFIFSYLCGSLPMSVVLSKTLGKEDIREKGSFNLGATNAYRVHGKKFGALVLILDMLKVMIVPSIYQYQHDIYSNNKLHFLIILFLGVFGHVFPIFLKFKGGKGVASSLATLIFINPLLFLLTIVIWLGIYLKSKVSSLASLGSFLAILLISCFLLDKISVFFILMITIMIYIKHIPNIKRILKNEELLIK